MNGETTDTYRQSEFRVPSLANRSLLGNVLKVLTLALCLSLVACGSGPEKTAKNWLDALNAGNITKAQEMSTPQTQALIQMSSTLGQGLAVGKYKIQGVKKINDTHSKVSVELLNDNEVMELDLRKIDGTWKVGISK